MSTFAQRHAQRRSQQLAEHAERLRHSPTPSEDKLWQALRAQQLGVQFRRQVVIAGYIVDFAAPEVRLVVEVDGGYHAGRLRADARRDAKLLRLGYRVSRLEAVLVLQQLPVAVERIRQSVAASR